MTIDHIVKQHYQTGLTHHRQGDLVQAAACYEKVLTLQQNHPDALHFLGVIALSQSDHQKAIELIGHAIAHCNTKAAYFNSYGIALREVRRWDDAVSAFQQAIRLDGNCADAWANLGLLQLDLKRFADAEQSLYMATLLAPKYSHLAKRYWKAFNEELDRLLETNTALNWRTLVYDRFFPAAALSCASSSCQSAWEKYGRLLCQSFPHVKPKFQFSPDSCRKIRIGFVVTDGGESEFFHIWQQAINSLQGDGFEILIFCKSSRHSFCRNHVTPDAVRIVPFDGSFEQIATMIRNEECDIVVYHHAETNPWGTCLAMTRPAPIQITSQETVNTKSWNTAVDHVIVRSKHGMSGNQWNEFFKDIVFAEIRKPDRIQKYPTIIHADDFAKDKAVMEYLEINLIYGCNLSCEHCTHFCKYSRGIEPLENIIAWYESWHEKIMPKNIRLIGGEPLLYPQLCEAIDITGRYWPETNILLTTNGLLLEKVSDEIIGMLCERNIHVYVSQHYNDEEFNPPFFRGIDRLIKFGIRYTIYTSYMNWRKMYHVNDQGTLLPYQSDWKQAWENCQTKNICPTLLQNRLYKCQHIAHVLRCMDNGLLGDEWNAVKSYIPLSPDASLEEMRRFVNSEAVTACAICPERYEYVDADTKKSGNR